MTAPKLTKAQREALEGTARLENEWGSFWRMGWKTKERLLDLGLIEVKSRGVQGTQYKLTAAGRAALKDGEK